LLNNMSNGHTALLPDWIAAAQKSTIVGSNSRSDSLGKRMNFVRMRTDVFTGRHFIQMGSGKFRRFEPY